jgi:hypothetical protein
MKSRIRSFEKLFWAVLLVGTSVDVRGVESTPNGMITRSMATDKNKIMETTVMDATCDMNPIPMQEPLSTLEAGKRLKDAAMKGDLERVKELIHKYAAQLSEEHVGLAFAWSVEHRDVRQFLLGQECPIKPTPKWVGDAFAFACAARGDLDAVNDILSGPIQPTQKWVVVALRNAAKNGHVEIVQKIVQEVVKIFHPKTSPVDKFHEYWAGEALKWVTLSPTEDGTWATMHLEIVKNLLDAAMKGDLERVKELIHKYAFQLSEEDLGLVLTRSVEHRDVRQFLLGQECPINPTPKWVGDAFACAAMKGDLDAVNDILSGPIQPTQKWVVVALKNAAKNGHVEIVKILSQKDFIVNYSLSRSENHPILLAMEKGHLNVLEHLLGQDYPIPIGIGTSYCIFQNFFSNHLYAIQKKKKEIDWKVFNFLLSGKCWAKPIQLKVEEIRKRLEGIMADAMANEFDIETAGNTIKALIENTTGELHKNVILKLNDYIESRGNAVGPVLESYLDNNNLPDGDVVEIIRHFQYQPRDPALVTSLLNRFLEGKKGISEELVRWLAPDLTVEATKTSFASKKILYPASLLRQLSKNPGIMGSHHSTLIIIDDFTRGVRIKDNAKIEKLRDCLLCNAPDRTSSVKGNIFIEETINLHDDLYVDRISSVKENILSEEKINVSEDDNNNAEVRIHTMTGNPQIRKKADMKDFE